MPADFRGAVRYKPFDDVVEFDELVALALAETVVGPAPSPLVKTQLMARIATSASARAGFSLRFVADYNWLAHPVPGIRLHARAGVARVKTSPISRKSLRRPSALYA